MAGTILSQGQAQISWQVQHFRKARYRFRGRRSTVARLGTDFVAGARSGADFVAGAVFRDRRYDSTLPAAAPKSSKSIKSFARLGKDFVAGARYFRKVKHRFRGRHNTLARSGTGFVAGAALSQGWAQFSWQARYFRKVKHRCSTFARSDTDLVAGAAFSQG